jgi:hypothetical protein
MNGRNEGLGYEIWKGRYLVVPAGGGFRRAWRGLDTAVRSPLRRPAFTSKTDLPRMQ